jgi:hypothetical protein
MTKKQVVILLVVLILIFASLFYLDYLDKKSKQVKQDENQIVEEEKYITHEVIGHSVEGRDIDVYTFGNGDIHLMFVGGIHGGYEWNSVVLAYKFIDYLKFNKEELPSQFKVSIIPSLNPDGVYEVVKKEGQFDIGDVPEGDKSLARFNANDVDLNRNFDCKWQPESTWRGRKVSAGTEVFSEPEAKAIRGFVLENDIRAGIFLHSQANNVYASECEEGVLPETVDIMNAYSRASGYGSVETFDAYEVTGDAEGWLASIGIPAITVELETHETIEWERNLSGFKALIEYYSKK